jgi:alkylhydroperoxidase family enzyme
MTTPQISDTEETWLADRAPGDTAFDRVVNHRPEYAEAFHRVEAAIWEQQVVPTELLELCQRRIAQLLRHRSSTERASELVAAVASWPTDPRFSERDRVCLAYAEQVLIDAEGVSDEQATAVVEAIGEGGFLVLTYACGIFETRTRADLALGLGRLS